MCSSDLGEIRILWDISPATYRIDDFQSGLSAPPDAFLIGVLKTNDLILHFVRLIRALQSLESTGESIDLVELGRVFESQSDYNMKLVPSLGASHQSINKALFKMIDRWGKSKHQGEDLSFFQFLSHELGLRPQ